MRETFWSGFVLLSGGEGLHTIDIYPPVGSGDLRYVDVYINGNYHDDVGSKADLASLYGEMFYKSLEDFKDDDWLSIDEVWPK